MIKRKMKKRKINIFTKNKINVTYVLKLKRYLCSDHSMFNSNPKFEYLNPKQIQMTKIRMIKTVSQIIIFIHEQTKNPG